MVYGLHRKFLKGEIWNSNKCLKYIKWPMLSGKCRWKLHSIPSHPRHNDYCQQHKCQHATVRNWGNQKTCTLLVSLQIDTSTLEMNLKISQKPTTKKPKKLEINLIYNPAIPCMDICQRTLHLTPEILSQPRW